MSSETQVPLLDQQFENVLNSANHPSVLSQHTTRTVPSQSSCSPSYPCGYGQQSKTSNFLKKHWLKIVGALILVIALVIVIYAFVKRKSKKNKHKNGSEDGDEYKFPGPFSNRRAMIPPGRPSPRFTEYRPSSNYPVSYSVPTQRPMTRPPVRPPPQRMPVHQPPPPIPHHANPNVRQQGVYPEVTNELAPMPPPDQNQNRGNNSQSNHHVASMESSNTDPNFQLLP